MLGSNPEVTLCIMERIRKHEIDSLNAHTESQRLIISLFVNVLRFQAILYFITYARKAPFSGARSLPTKSITGIEVLNVIGHYTGWGRIN